MTSVEILSETRLLVNGVLFAKAGDNFICLSDRDLSPFGERVRAETHPSSLPYSGIQAGTRTYFTPLDLYDPGPYDFTPATGDGAMTESEWRLLAGREKVRKPAGHTRYRKRPDLAVIEPKVLDLRRQGLSYPQITAVINEGLRTCYTRRTIERICIQNGLRRDLLETQAADPCSTPGCGLTRWKGAHGKVRGMCCKCARDIFAASKAAKKSSTRPSCANEGCTRVASPRPYYKGACNACYSERRSA